MQNHHETSLSINPWHLRCVIALSFFVGAVLAYMSGAWQQGGLVGFLVATALGALPGAVAVVLAFPVTLPLILWLSSLMQRKFAH